MRLFIVSLFLSFFSHSALASIFEAPIETTNGQTTTITEIAKGRPIYLKFWATWCQPCLKEMPHFEGIQRKFGKEVAVIGVNIWINESQDHIEKVVEKFNLSMPLLRDSSRILSKHFNFSGTPYHVLINSQGRIIYKGHEASPQLDTLIFRISKKGTDQQKSIQRSETQAQSARENLEVTMYTATWCDWYFEKSRPLMSKTCIDTQRAFNELVDEFPNVKWAIKVSPLWTDEKSLGEYVKKYEISAKTTIDKNSQDFHENAIDDFPAIVIKKGNQLYDKIDPIFEENTVAETLRKRVLDNIKR